MPYAPLTQNEQIVREFIIGEEGLDRYDALLGKALESLDGAVRDFSEHLAAAESFVERLVGDLCALKSKLLYVTCKLESLMSVFRSIQRPHEQKLILPDTAFWTELWEIVSRGELLDRVQSNGMVFKKKLDQQAAVFLREVVLAHVGRYCTERCHERLLLGADGPRLDEGDTHHKEHDDRR